MADVDFFQKFSPAESTRGSWAPIMGSTLSGGLPSASRGRYAQLSYIVGSEPGALSLALSGGNIILPVSSVNISEPVRIENEPGDRLNVTIQNPICSVAVLANTTVYNSVTIGPESVSIINFSTNIILLEIFNNDTSLPIYLGFNNEPIETLSGNALPVTPETYYSIERDIAVVYIGNADVTESIDVRVVGHYK